MDNNLATVQEVTEIQPIVGADQIEVASVLGWKCVVKKGDFKVGDKGIYICIDTIVPEVPQFEFLRRVNFRVKTVECKSTKIY
jgi:RNA ligase (TIGR02306 family)